MTLGPARNRRPPSAMPSTGSSRIRMPGRRRPTVPSRPCVACIHRDHRRSFGQSEALDDLRAEALPPYPPRFWLHRLGARNDQPQTGEIAILGRAGIAVEERVGSDENGRFQLRCNFRNEFVVQRRGIEEQPHADQQRQDHAGCQPEGMENGQNVEQDVLRREDQPRFSLHRIGDDVADATERLPSERLPSRK